MPHNIIGIRGDCVSRLLSIVLGVLCFMNVVKYDNIQGAIMNADKIIFHTTNKEYVLNKDSFQYELGLNFIENILEGSYQMPALGVALNDEVVEEKKAKDWVEFVFNERCECGGMFFDKLLVFIENDMGGVNVFREVDGRYEGRCFYINLRDDVQRLGMSN